jgi:hypothetical protein
MEIANAVEPPTEYKLEFSGDIWSSTFISARAEPATTAQGRESV